MPCYSPPHVSFCLLEHRLICLSDLLSVPLSLLPALSGVLYRLIAEASSGAERDDHLEKAGEALKDALELRIEMTGVRSMPRGRD